MEDSHWKGGFFSVKSDLNHGMEKDHPLIQISPATVFLVEIHYCHGKDKCCKVVYHFTLTYAIKAKNKNASSPFLLWLMFSNQLETFRFMGCYNCILFIYYFILFIDLFLSIHVCCNCKTEQKQTTKKIILCHFLHKINLSQICITLKISLSDPLQI